MIAQRPGFRAFPNTEVKSMERKKTIRQNRIMLLFCLPALLLFTVFVVVPFFMGLDYSFYDWDGISPERAFVGIKNYIGFFTNKHSIHALIFTLQFTAVTVLSQNIGAIIIANLLDTIKRGGNLFKGIFFVPNVLSGVIVAFIWSFIFTKALPSMSEQTGLRFLGISWFNNSTTAFWATVIVAFWIGTGYLVIIYLAGLNTIDTNILEAARLDGANPVQMLYRIKMPLIMQSVIIGLFLVTMNGVKQFEIVFLMTQGGPYRSTETLALLSYNTAYARNNFGQATAQAVVLFILCTVITLAQVLLLKNKEVES